MPIMGSATFTLIVGSPWLVGQQDADTTIREELHNGAQELTDTEIDQIKGRTPIMRGGLVQSIFGDATTDTSSDDLSFLYPDDAGQLAAWNRVYVAYVEGGVLGRPTWTNPPREIFMQVTTTDIPTIIAWAYKYADLALQRLAKGTGVTII